MKEENEPLPDDEARRLLAPYGASGDLAALAVSGGPDSMALAYLTRRAGLRVIALIVDHGLRAESGAEAALVAQRLADIGIKAEVLRWDHEAVSSRLHARARAARYDLLLSACEKHGAKTLLLAHHRGDQAETILMRLAKGSGLRGLSGMARERRERGILLARPLLGLPKSRLVATCHAAGIPFVTDPSNNAERFARGRLRRVAEGLAQEGFTPERLLDLGARAGDAADALDHYALHLLRASSRVTCGGAVDLDFAVWRDAPRAVRLRVMEYALGYVHPSDYAPQRAALLALDVAFAEGEKGPQTRSLGGCLVQKTGQKMRFLREFASLSDAFSAPFPTPFLWDGRWRVTVAPSASGLEVRPLGFQPKALLDRLSPDLRRHVPQGRVRACLPALWQGSELRAVPQFTEQEQGDIQADLLPPPWK